MPKYQEFTSKPIKGDLSTFTIKHSMDLEKLEYYRISSSKEERSEAAKKAHEQVDWKAVNGSKDNVAIQMHRSQTVYAWDAKTGEFVGEYYSQMEAGRQLNVHQGNIRSALDNGKVRKGYKFTTSKF